MCIKKDFHYDELLYIKFDDIIKEYYTDYVNIHMIKNCYKFDLLGFEYF